MKKQNILLVFCLLLSCAFLCSACTTDTIPTPTYNHETDTLINKGEPLRLNSIYFDYNSDVILADAKKSLDYLADIMLQYPDLVIEIDNHTDALGKENLNLTLSQRRASSIVRYMNEKLGIFYEQLKAVGKGETEILNRCINGVKDCTDEEHRFNRRTEFKIIDGAEQLVVPKPPKR